MINQLASPSVCVVDDEPEDYEPILAALNDLYVSCVHIAGNEIDKLPPHPFKRLQLVFLDLHLTKSIGKDAASHTANVFTKIVSSDTAPIIVVIWSKYAQDRSEGDETEADIFKRTLLDAEPKFKGKVIFVEMAKPMPDARPDDWTGRLKTEIESALANQAAVEALWTWNSLVNTACMRVGEDLTATAAATAEQSGRELKECLKESMQRLAKAQGEGDFTAATAPGHLVTVLTQLLLDQLDHVDGAALAAHGAWLAAEPAHPAPAGFAARMNGLLLTAAVSAAAAPFFPGTVYRITDPAKFGTVFGRDLASLLAVCSSLKQTQQRWPDWQAGAKPVLVEISPACDVAQNKRVNALLIAGLIVPAAFALHRQRPNESFATLPILHLRWSAPDFAEQDAALIFCHRYRVSMPQLPDWIAPWFRLREMPTAALGAAHAGNAARIGFVQMQD